MRIFLFLIVISYLLSFNLYGEQILVLEFEYVKNSSIKKIYYDYTIINKNILKNFVCKKFKIPAIYNVKEIIKFLLNNKKCLYTNTFLKDFYVKEDNVYLKSVMILDLNYKILEKDSKKYYIFNACFPERKKENKLLTFLKNLFQ